MSSDLVYDPLDQVTINNPHHIYDRLRSEAPVFWHHRTSSWVLTRYDDCRFVLSNHELFARDQRRIGRQLPASQDNMQIQDPPTLIAFRSQLSDAFKKQDTSKLISIARSRLEANILRRSPDVPFDFMADVALDVALSLSLDLFGVSANPPSNYFSIFEGLARQMDSTIDPSRRTGGALAASLLRSLMHDWVTAPRSSGLIRSLSESARSAESENDYIVNTMCGVFNACFSTLYAITGSAFCVMLKRPHLLETKVSIATDVAAAELIRFISPAQGSSRYAVTSVEIGNRAIKGGDALIVLFAAANWDPATFRSPGELNLSRHPNPHLGFGWGSHFCIGASFASGWVREVLSFLHDSHHRIELAGEVEYMNMATLRCLSKLPMIKKE